MSSLDTIKAWQRRPYSGLVAPWRHSDPLVRGLYAKLKMWAAAKDMAGIGRDPEQSHLYGIASDARDEAEASWRRIITEAWTARAMSRGYVPVERGSIQHTHEAV